MQDWSMTAWIAEVKQLLLSAQQVKQPNQDYVGSNNSFNFKFLLHKM